MSGHRQITGISASRGLALGRARIREPRTLDLLEERIGTEQIEGELARLRLALAQTRAELVALRERVHGAIAHELSELLDLHTLILDDPELLGSLDQLVRGGLYSAAYALKLQRDRLAAVFDSMDDPYFKSRKEDLDQVVGRVFAALHRGQKARDACGLAGDVLVTDSVAPSELTQLMEQGVVAIVTTLGSALSHSAILARSLHLPMIVGAHEALQYIDESDTLMVDAGQGTLIVDPSADDLRQFRSLARESERQQRQLARLKGAPTRTRDGVEIRLFANAESPADVAQAYELGAVGVGLYRTEFLFLQRRELPNEEEQYLAYRDAVLAMGGRPVTIRTLDLGADKADRSGLALSHEPNPALGVRGVRLSLRRHTIFLTQLRAILRASQHGPVRILIPMICGLEELVEVRRLIQSCACDLREEGLPIADRFELGAMIEVPAAALALQRLLRQVDFASIGTNDLIQYLLAVDRGNDALGDLYSPLHPVVLRLLYEMIARGHKTGRPVFICGELAADPRLTPMLLALGLTDFSMHPSNLLEVRHAVRETDRAALVRHTRALLNAPDRAAIERWITRVVVGH